MSNTSSNRHRGGPRGGVFAGWEGLAFLEKRWMRGDPVDRIAREASIFFNRPVSINTVIGKRNKSGLPPRSIRKV